jgi:hypothetical protein
MNRDGLIDVTVCMWKDLLHGIGGLVNSGIEFGLETQSKHF